ncbi:hypothetical protein B0I32_10615 [Nonomuraea fuscirosea]|uniref:Enoyl-ACP reductase-like protein n=1 Tax=Nonomuraea fuscirosea TaxID=1291556 RepID=A0A2T0N1R5_9ACTN|nr:hypothetical protein [Nonomuraea fuscirosea]PRX65879.1 hypothetical protein B0I32_10615 [Nonomuraea fuscirosea]
MHSADVQSPGDGYRRRPRNRRRHRPPSGFGRLDVLHANGPGRVVAARPAHEMPEADWDLQIDVSLKAAFLAARTFCPLPAGTEGALVIASS